MTSVRALARTIALASLLISGCDRGGEPPPRATPPPAYGPPPGGPRPPFQQPPGARSPGRQSPAPGYPQQPPPPAAAGPAPSPPGPGPQPPARRSASPRGRSERPDPINAADRAWLRQRARAVLRELVTALPARARERVRTLPLVFDDSPGEVNAFAACIDGKALLAVTDGMLTIEAHLAEAKAIDDVFGARKVDAYVAFVAENQRPGQPVVHPPSGFFDPHDRHAPRKIARQHAMLDEQLAFVLGHELAHHHLGHLPCTGGSGPLGAGELARALSSTVPLFNQPNELAADVAGTNNLLAAGARRSGYRWTEGGALLTLRFFSGLDRLSAADILFGFERSHPVPQVRRPVVQQAANTWRMTGGVGLPVLGM